ncbi:ZIP-like iron-zinc transporter [Suillus fuscotomentosus]|uniref:ZIP-like iron-zinc transporter n=1 Tax=Suillus fuscotomentosus TaxID=1912939 RepID=A0AAD4E262_9AGAM|nr:ZIP-like iron-zinc transporter [Suillus fuscotomentosus]KAG1898373.1 ZIP-like iron-zinc transporter [Suillus fuscotomentosus]
MATRFASRALVLALLVCSVVALESARDSLVVRESEIHECTSIEKLSALKIAVEDEESPIMRQVFAWLFPFGPGWNSVLGTFYISSVPNFILAFIPAEIHPDTLNTMTAFATGGLLSDVFLHLIPHAFMGEHQDPGAHFVMVEEKRNILIGLGIFVGFATFFVMEKSLRVLGGEDGHSHSHGHSHTHSTDAAVSADSAQASGASTSLSPDGLRSRGSGKQNEVDRQEPVEQAHAATAPSKLSAYLNLFGDFVHNITDGLAMAASFYSSPLIGATTTLACFAHEIPHEIADYSILVRSGFTKRQAMQSQFLTAIGAFVGTFMGIAIHNLSASGTMTESLDLAAGVRQDASGILGTTVQPADLVIPFVAGGFMYIGAVAVLPTLLAESKSGAQALREFGAMAFGVLCMFFVAWNE